ncbi:MAG: hypothetical protein E7A54_15105 [Morganella morganii]|nr:hypothetical protein [Morganella morganii]MDU1074701.1 hypothetical protein [Morganella morganii]HCT6323965.1 hypothetical protein [Morganella morganii]
MAITMLNSIITSGVTLFIFIAGLCLGPILEKRKDDRKSKALKADLIEEFNDEVKERSKTISKMLICIGTLREFEEIVNDSSFDTEKNAIGFGEGPSYYKPMNILFYFLIKTIENSFSHLNPVERKELKIINQQVIAINSYLSNMKKPEQHDKNETDDLIKNYYRYIYTTSCLINSIWIFTKNKNAIMGASDEEIINNVSKVLCLGFKYTDIIIRTKVKLI